jgi:hypothetical protein
MGYVKYTKTATFLFPLLGIPKAIFSCNVKNSFGTTMFTTRFYNAFIRDCKVDNYKEGFVFVVVRAYQDVDFQCFYDTMGAFENYVDDYERGDYIVFVYSIIDKFKADYKLLMDGKYSKISPEGKKAVLSNNYFSGKPYTLPLILGKSEALKKGWEDRLKVDLLDQEVWSIITPEKEEMCDDILEDLVGESSIKPNNILNEKTASKKI